ncbi:hypothetical protein [Pyrobaculum sp.]|uniref:hypothetical protein n=1 Tax=Pyrobaculum sp. TaxID=2004705 RepID=UPI003D0F5F53
MNRYYRYPVFSDVMSCPFCYGWKVLGGRSLDDYIRELKKRKVVVIDAVDNAIPDGWEGFIYVQPMPPDIARVEAVADTVAIDYNTVALWRKKKMILWFLEPVW